MNALRIAVPAIFLAATFGSFAADKVEYVGVGSCRKCHLASSDGNQYGKWQETEHSNAFHVLTTEQSKKIAKAKNIDDPTKSVDCLRCHVTAYEAPAAQKRARFDLTLGVQCEQCHGPGSKHVDERLEGDAGGDDKPMVLPKDEIVGSPSPESCRKCHNKDSPTYKPFAFYKAMPVISHLDPRKKRPADYYEKLSADPKDDPNAVAPKKKE